jgi:SAM-dependent methyltransferase
MELLQAARVVGLRRLWNSRRAAKWGWEGIIRGHCLTRALQTALQIDLLQAMHRDGPIDPRTFAAERGLDADVLTALCDYLYARRILSKQDGRFGLDEQGRFLVETDLLQGWFKLVDGYEPVLHALGPLTSGGARYGNGVKRDPELVAVGSGLASEGFYFPLVADIIRRRGWKTVLDIGCGDGTFLRSLCRALPQVSAIGIDLSAEAIARGCATRDAQGLGGRIRLHQGDALEIDQTGVLPAEVGAATSFFVLHELASPGGGDGELPSFLRRFRQTYPRTALIIVETIRPDAAALRRRPGPAVEYFLLHDLSKQAPLNRERWQRQLRDAGFKSIEERNLSFARSAIYVAQ